MHFNHPSVHPSVHPPLAWQNPHCPTMHFNYRYFETEVSKQQVFVHVCVYNHTHTTTHTQPHTHNHTHTHI